MSAPTGLVAVPVIVPDMVEWIAGQYYDFTDIYPASSQGAQTATANQIITSPLWVPVTASIDRLSINITTAASAGNKARLGIFEKASGSPLPGALLLDAGEVAIDATGAVAATVAIVLPGPRWYHVALHPQATISVTGMTPIGGPYGGAASGASDQRRITAIMNQSYGALPAAFSVSSYSAAARRVQVRAV